METNIKNVSDAFSKQAVVFDSLYKENKLSEYLRSKFRAEVLSHLKPNSSILELNCGTGMDAVYFAERGHTLLATDNAPGMLTELKRKIHNTPLEKKIETLQCSFHDIDTIENKKFDHIISNFGGLNCTDDLKDVLLKLEPLLNSKGKVTLMIMPKICPWEIIMLIKGDFKTAFRRFKKGTPAHIEGVHFNCYYYNPGYVVKALKKEFKRVSLQGVFITVPPEFYQNFVERYPKLFSLLCKIDSGISALFPFTNLCDHYLITLERKN